MCKKISKYLFLGCLGGSIYYGLEILFRGFSHWSMFVLGGICFLFFYPGKSAQLSGTAVASDYSLYDLYNGNGISDRTDRK